MMAYRMLVSFLAGAIYASAAWSLTLPCENCAWHLAPMLILFFGGIAGAALVLLAALDVEVSK